MTDDFKAGQNHAAHLIMLALDRQQWDLTTATPELNLALTGATIRAFGDDKGSEMIAELRAASERLQAMPHARIAMEIIEERTRQIAKGYTAEHDDEATDGEIGQAAGLVMLELRSDDDARFTAGRVATYILDKHQDRRRQIIIALALAVAEIERLDRAKEKA